MIFATLVLEKPPLQWADVPGAIITWITVVGGFATVFLALWLLCETMQSPYCTSGCALAGTLTTVTFLATVSGIKDGDKVPSAPWPRTTIRSSTPSPPPATATSTRPSPSKSPTATPPHRTSGS